MLHLLALSINLISVYCISPITELAFKVIQETKDKTVGDKKICLKRPLAKDKQQTDLFESLQLLPQSDVLSSELLDIQARQSGSVLEALLDPLLHADYDKNRTRINIMQSYYSLK